MGIAVGFPDLQPKGYEWFDDEPRFDPGVHLALEMPAEIFSLDVLGYDEQEIASKATAVALTSPFRILSDEGADTLRSVSYRLESFVKPAGDRIERMVRGGCYRSRWLRDLAISPEVTEHMSAIYGVEVAPHPMPLHLGHLNYPPSRLEEAVDKWHHDTLPLDYVMMVHDPASLEGGRFEYFLGTKHEAAELAANGQTPPRDRVVSPDFDGPGYAIALHGDMVVHRAAPLDAPGERITMVNGYVAMDTSVDAQSRCADLTVVDDHEALYAEWAKFAAWRAAGRLETLIAELEPTSDAELVAASLEEAVFDVRLAIEEMRSGVQQAAHYEK